jgi:type IV secretory pathway VirB10-like protein
MQPRTPGIPSSPRLAPKRLGFAALMVGAALFGMVFMSLLHRQQATVQPPPPPLPALYEVQGEVDAFQRLQLKTSWAGEDRTPPKPAVVPAAPPVLPPPPPLFPAQAQVATLAPLPAVAPPPPPVVPVPPLQAPTQASPPKGVPPTPAPAVATTPTPKTEPNTEPKEDHDWLFAEVKAPGKRQGSTPHAQGSPDGSSGGSRGRQSQLFPPAQWERPANPLKVIYQSQLLQAIVEQGIVTGEDSDIRLRLVETLFDKFGQQTVLLPQGTILLGKAQGEVKRGQTRIAIGLTKAELPDGTDLPLTGKVGDNAGRVGVPGDVENKYKQVALSAILTAVLSVGSRASAGSTTGYNPTLEQEFARDIGQSLNRSGNKIVDRMLDVQPEISVPPLAPVTVQLKQSYSLQTPPIIVHR